MKVHTYSESFLDFADAVTYIESNVNNYSNEDWKLAYANITFLNGKYRVGVQFTHGQYDFGYEEEHPDAYVD